MGEVMQSPQTPPSTIVEESTSVTTSDGQGGYETTSTHHIERIEGEELDEFHDTEFHDDDASSVLSDDLADTETEQWENDQPEVVEAVQDLEQAQAEAAAATVTAQLAGDLMLNQTLQEINQNLLLLLERTTLTPAATISDSESLENETEAETVEVESVTTTPPEANPPPPSEPESKPEPVRPERKRRKRSIASLKERLRR